MSQLSFDLGGPEPLPPEDLASPNLFFAVRPPTYVCEEIMVLAAEICRRHGLAVPRPSRVLHLTLCKIGNYGWDDSVIKTALEIGDRVAGQTTAVSLTKLMHFRNSNAVVLATDETPRPLFDLREALARELRRQFFKTGSGFKPHATFVYEDRFEIPEALLPRPILCPVEAFELISSPPRETRHETLRVWPLGQNA